MSSLCERIDKAVVAINTAQRHQTPVSSTAAAADGNRLSDSQREMVEMAVSELSAAVCQLSTAVIKHT